jgi:peptidoglycan/LPS O-acetylase OafA/YrhL
MPSGIGASRISEIDGLRAVAVLGVLYVHVWSFGCGTVGMHVGPIDINRVMSLFGTGVDLFFVISGFCMYMMYKSVVSSDSLAARALRTAPMQGLGRISYSFYLWHWFPAVWIGSFMTEHLGPRPFVPISATIFATLAVVPLAWTSYSLFEAPYFAERESDTNERGRPRTLAPERWNTFLSPSKT